MEQRLSPPEMSKKLSETPGDNTDQSLSDILSEILKTSGDLPISYAGLTHYLQKLFKLLRCYNEAGGKLGDSEAPNMLIIKLDIYAP